MSLLESTIHSLMRDNSAPPLRQPATLFLSDVDQLEAEVQEPFARLLTRLGPLRIVSSSRESLAALAQGAEVSRGPVLALATVEIRLPPLAERLEDLPLVAQMFVEECNRHGKKQIAGLGRGARPVGRLPLACEPARAGRSRHGRPQDAAEGPYIMPNDLPAKIQIALDAAARPRKREQTIVLEKFLAEIEEELIRRALARAKGNKTKAARLLGMTRPRLYRRLVQLGLAEADEVPPEAISE